jgi:hypothetical protein
VLPLRRAVVKQQQLGKNAPTLSIEVRCNRICGVDKPYSRCICNFVSSGEVSAYSIG